MSQDKSPYFGSATQIIDARKKALEALEQWKATPLDGAAMIKAFTEVNDALTELETLRNQVGRLTYRVVAADFDASKTNAEVYALRGLMEDLAEAIHYPDCWCTTAYPTLANALREVYGTFQCTNQVTHEGQTKVNPMEAQTGKQEPFAWLVCSVNKDGSLSLEGAEQFQEKAHEAINDAITDRLDGAKDWVVCPAYLQAPQAVTELEKLRRQVEDDARTIHNLNWALGTEGYEEMATEEDRADHDEGQRIVSVNLQRMAENKARYDVLVPEGKTLLEVAENLTRQVEALTSQASRAFDLKGMIDRLCHGLENYRNTAPWGDDDEEALAEARKLSRDLDLSFDPLANEHFDAVAIEQFSWVLKAKMAENRAKGRQGWEKCPPAKLSTMLRHHVEKGDPRDVALFCMMLWHQAASIESPVLSKRVYLVATGETCNGLETYTRHEALVPMADQEVLWTAEPMAKLFANFAAADLATWSREMLEQFVGRAHEELVKLLTWTGELYATPLSNNTMRAIRTRALDEFGTGQAQGELWDQILMRETARTIQATAKGGA